MKALVKYGNNPGEVEIREVGVPEIGCDDVLLEVKAAGIQGHEFSGIISKLGNNVTGFSKGDRVVSETAAVICGKCPQCLTGNYHLCPDRKGFGYGVDGAFTISNFLW